MRPGSAGPCFTHWCDRLMCLTASVCMNSPEVFVAPCLSGYVHDWGRHVCQMCLQNNMCVTDHGLRWNCQLCLRKFLTERNWIDWVNKVKFHRQPWSELFEFFKCLGLGCVLFPLTHGTPSYAKMQFTIVLTVYSCSLPYVVLCRFTKMSHIQPYRLFEVWGIEITSRFGSPVTYSNQSTANSGLQGEKKILKNTPSVNIWMSLWSAMNGVFPEGLVHIFGTMQRQLESTRCQTLPL